MGTCNGYFAHSHSSFSTGVDNVSGRLVGSLEPPDDEPELPEPSVSGEAKVCVWSSRRCRRSSDGMRCQPQRQ